MIALSVSAGSIAALIGRRGFAFRPIGVFSGVCDLPYRRGLLALTKGIHGPPNTNFARLVRICSGFMLASLIVTGAACVAVDEVTSLAALEHTSDEPIRLPEAEHMIDDLDRVMTEHGTISIKTPDVWGQDRLAKFRSEYESQMAGWLKQGFKSDINASVRHTESEATRVLVGANAVEPLPKNATATATTTPAAATINVESFAKSQAALIPNPAANLNPAEKTPVSLEPTVVLDEHSNYLNHLNQLRRINSGDDLTDRPGYGLYLIRIPVTLSPGPRSRRGKGAIITVSARSVLTKHTLRNALRNAVINETVTSLTQAIVNRTAHTDDQDPVRGAGTFSLLSFADTELYHGADEHRLAQKRGRAPARRRARRRAPPQERACRRMARGQNCNRLTIFLEEAAAPSDSNSLAARADPLEELGDSILKHDFQRIAQVQPGKTTTRSSSRPPAENRPPATLLRAAHTNRQHPLIRPAHPGGRPQSPLEARHGRSGPELKPEVLKQTSFFEPEPTDQALQMFQKYVDMKWPLRVYAIEPVIAQQNVADAFARRKFSAIDLVGSAYSGPIKALSGIEAQRQASDDETAIRLNPTMVGFGAGQSTFGWIFYPRLQTNGGRRGRIITDIALLATGRVPDPTGSDQSIEPGQRECTALVEMPNFVPKIEFITVANWFRTSEVGDGQKSDLEKAAVLGRRLVLAEEILIRAKVEGHYRTEEYQIATERLNQLRSLMPTQRMVVRVPFADSQNDARIFCSHGSQLRPTLTGWHGKPPEEGDETTPLPRRQELQHSRHPRDRRRKVRDCRTRQPAIAPGHHPQRRLPHPELARHIASRYQCRHAQRCLESPPHQDGVARSSSQAAASGRKTRKAGGA